MSQRILPVIALIAVAGLSGVVSCSPARVLSGVTPAAPVLKDTCRFIRHVPPVASGT
jgi:hypothetical protein